MLFGSSAEMRIRVFELVVPMELWMGGNRQNFRTSFSSVQFTTSAQRIFSEKHVFKILLNLLWSLDFFATVSKNIK